MDDQRQGNQLEPTYSSSVLIQDVVLKTCRKQWTIEKGGKKGSKISMLMAWHDDDDDNTLDKRGKNILRHYLFRDKIIENCLKIDATH